MDAFIVSEFVKKSLQSKKKNLEHAAFIINTPPAQSNLPVQNNNLPVQNNYSSSNKLKAMDLSDKSNNATYIDNSANSVLSDTTEVADNSDNYKITDNTDNSANAYSSTDNSSNIVVNNIKVTNLQNNMSEDLDDYDEQEEYVINNKANKVSSVTFLLMLLINSYAAYLSWECNTNKGYPLALKVVFSFFAFIFGTMYLLYYILFRFDECNNFRSMQ
jgi:hypothetical protein